MGIEFGDRKFPLACFEEDASPTRLPLATQGIPKGAQMPLQKHWRSEQQSSLSDKARNTGNCEAIISRRQFLHRSCGIPFALLVMSQMCGMRLDSLEAQTTKTVRVEERSIPLQGRFVFDALTGLDVPNNDAQWSADLVGDGTSANPTVTRDLYFENYVRQMYLNSDTSVSVLSAAPPFELLSSRGTDASRIFNIEALTEAAKKVNETAGRSVMLAHALITPGKEGWTDKVAEALKEGPPAGWTLYDRQIPLDHESMNWFYGEALRTGIINIGISVRKGSTRLNLIEAAIGNPELNFIIYADSEDCLDFERLENELGHFERTGGIDWECGNLSEIPMENSPSNIYVVTGSAFALAMIASPRLAAAILGTWIKSVGPENVLWGTGSFQGSPQWQIEGLRRLEIPEDMQERFGFQPLGQAGGRVKSRILGLNATELYRPQDT